LKANLDFYKAGKPGVQINPDVPACYRGISMRSRLRAHATTEKRLREKGMSYSLAHKKALKKEHQGLSQKRISTYEGKLGSVARHSKWKPHIKKRIRQ
jgi:hypothetical protein